MSPTRHRTVALVVAAGSGARLGGETPKQFQRLAGRMLFEYSLSVFCESSLLQSVVLVVPQSWLEKARLMILADKRFTKHVKVVAGGATRQDSVFAGLQSAPPSEYVVVHDAARPFLEADWLREVLAAAARTGAATLAWRVSDTLVRSKREGRSDWMLELVDREEVWSVQTPQAFRFDLLLRAHEQARDNGLQATDDGFLVRHLGEPVEIVEGALGNLKLTHAADWKLAERLLVRESETR